ncbi:Crp/Fnr family transcriptional regulator [Asinibacterium sp. OR53]|uniref:Crp/Fnr family transcriptional regulator n=1 Tax=Asinibacterium sp. OR53 TaxID=925409 RepID=UPI0004B7BB42|nr:cyclic nucleotide-binding domain-containing protein [Asinibacterium sp. OR53]
METQSILLTFREKMKDFLTLNEEEWLVFADYISIRELTKNECFARAGKVCRELGFIIQGGLRYCSQVEGKEITGYFCFENSFVTALKSYHTGEPCLYDIRALDKTILVTLTKKNMEALYAHPLLCDKIERFGRLVAENFNLLFEDRLKAFVIKTPEERYLDLLESGKDIINRIPVQYIAQFIGITPVSLSRIRKRILDATQNAVKKAS